MASSDTVTLVSKTEEEEKKGVKMQDNLLYWAVVVKMFSLLYVASYIVNSALEKAMQSMLTRFIF